ncbi:MAG TPA: NADPH-dependent FMN reductase [Gemmatimonadaceae bacterium]|nr:NADPH-dependent FMN reductase [Gemmatimonadaceae bacterium]
MTTAAAKQVLVVLGSLQARSSNGTLARALLSHLGGGVSITFTRALYDLPPFNADVEAGTPPAVVGVWREELAAADIVLFATPEYAFGIPGSLKNALDWVVGTGEFVGKRVALLGVSTMGSGASFALEALDRTIRVMSAEVIGMLSVGHVRGKLDENGQVSDPETRDALARLASDIAASLSV